jgi:hypothetical protein
MSFALSLVQINRSNKPYGPGQTLSPARTGNVRSSNAEQAAEELRIDPGAGTQMGLTSVSFRNEERVEKTRAWRRE